MGQTLSEPILTKHTQSHMSNKFIAAATEMQGWRIGMEDAHQVVLEIRKVLIRQQLFVYAFGWGGRGRRESERGEGRWWRDGEGSGKEEGRGQGGYMNE